MIEYRPKDRTLTINGKVVEQDFYVGEQLDTVILTLIKLKYGDNFSLERSYSEILRYIHDYNKHCQASACNSNTNFIPDVEGAIAIATDYCWIDGAHHKNWVINEMIKCLMPDEDRERLGWNDKDWLEECVAP